jgi:hypothetical protein
VILKVLKGRSFGNLLGYLFNHQDRPPAEEMEARGLPQEQGREVDPSRGESQGGERNKDGPYRGRPPDDAEQYEQKKTDHAEEVKREKRGELIVSNMAGRTEEELREEFEILAGLRPDVEVNVLHIIISMPPEDHVSPEMQARIVFRFAALYKLDETMYAAIGHDEHQHYEIHLVASTINLKGRLPSDSFDYDKVEAIARQLESEFGLSRNKSSRDAMRRSPTQGEWKQFERTRELSHPLRLQALIDSALGRERTFTEFAERLRQMGVELQLRISDADEVTGSVYEHEGKFIRGRRLGHGYTWPGLQREWPDQQERKGRMIYDTERDYEAFSHARSRANGIRGSGEFGEHERLTRAVERDRRKDERTERPTVAHRNPSRPNDPVGAGGREEVRDACVGGQGTKRRGRRVSRGVEDGI